MNAVVFNVSVVTRYSSTNPLTPSILTIKAGAVENSLGENVFDFNSQNPPANLEIVIGELWQLESEEVIFRGFGKGCLM